MLNRIADLVVEKLKPTVEQAAEQIRKDIADESNVQIENMQAQLNVLKKSIADEVVRRFKV